MHLGQSLEELLIILRAFEALQDRFGRDGFDPCLRRPEGLRPFARTSGASAKRAA